MHADGSLAAAINSGVRGTAELVIWKTGAASQPASSTLEVYQLELAHPPRSLGQAELWGSAGPNVNPTVLAGDVDPSSPGSEFIVVGGEPSGRTRVCVFGGISDGELHLLGDFHMPRRALGNDPSTPMIGDVVADVNHLGSEIVLGGQRGRVYAVGLERGRASVLSVLRAFPDRPRASARSLAVGDLMPDHPGDEVAVGDDGTVGDGLVRIFDGRTQQALAEFTAVPPPAAPTGVELWVGDVLSAFPGVELIVGQGPAGGDLRVFTLASGVPTHVLDVPSLGRSTSLHSHLAIGDLLPELEGNEIAVAQGDPGMPVQVLNLDADHSNPVATVYPPAKTETITALAAAH